MDLDTLTVRTSKGLRSFQGCRGNTGCALGKGGNIFFGIFVFQTYFTITLTSKILVGAMRSYRYLCSGPCVLGRNLSFASLDCLTRKFGTYMDLNTVTILTSEGFINVVRYYGHTGRGLSDRGEVDNPSNIILGPAIF